MTLPLFFQSLNCCSRGIDGFVPLLSVPPVMIQQQPAIHCISTKVKFKTNRPQNIKCSEFFVIAAVGWIDGHLVAVMIVSTKILSEIMAASRLSVFCRLKQGTASIYNILFLRCLVNEKFLPLEIYQFKNINLYLSFAKFVKVFVFGGSSSLMQLIYSVLVAYTVLQQQKQ
ncbi:hypothetical protein FF38_09777 [Lucilia cuprina]|uniref:Uncharacterized protein n=1 Tax=Lucilia cuprina TaxID=7375 RepID=A0A0L0BNZ2_LUCCU|nr:hypothetical protein FF38_09777 [Lucilia cuprina]